MLVCNSIDWKAKAYKKLQMIKKQQAYRESWNTPTFIVWFNKTLFLEIYIKKNC